MNLGNDIYLLTEEIYKTENESDLANKMKDKILDVYMEYNRYKHHKMQKPALTHAILKTDDLRCMLKLAVQLKVIRYEDYKKWDEEAQKLVKRMITEKNVIFGSSKR